MKCKSIPVISLRKSNEHGGNYLMNLYTGKRLYSYEWKNITIGGDVNKIVETIEGAEN